MPLWSDCVCVWCPACLCESVGLGLVDSDVVWVVQLVVEVEGQAQHNHPLLTAEGANPGFPSLVS